ncbi:MAG: GNAT family N-acetyltransferase [Ardenticatenaceae bacterium]
MVSSVQCQIRPLAAADEPVLWEIVYHAIYVPDDRAPPPRSIVHHPNIARYVRGWGRAHDSGYAAVVPDTRQVVGAAWLRLLTAPERGYGYIDDRTPELTIALLPRYRGMGIGTRMMNALIASAAQRYRAISLSVSPENPAMRLYARLGFEVVGGSELSLTMKKELQREK